MINYNNVTIGAIIFSVLCMLAIAAGIIALPILVIAAISNLLPAVTIPITIYTWCAVYFLMTVFVLLVKLSRFI